MSTEKVIRKRLSQVFKDDQIKTLIDSISRMHNERIPLAVAQINLSILDSELEKHGEKGTQALCAIRWLLRSMYASNTGKDF
jgi:hypothetical protein